MHDTPQHNSRTLAPVSENERIVSLDVLRGVAILGIFFVNIAFFSGPMAMMLDPAAMIDQPVSEQLAWSFIKVFAEYKFVSLFSLLFGIGLIVQFNRAMERGGTFGMTYMRRLLVLLVIGLLHGLLIWYGDILFMYAVGGFVLFLFRKCRPATLLIWAGCIFAFATLMYAGILALGVHEQRNNSHREVISAHQQPTEDERAVQHVTANDRSDRVDRWTEALQRWEQAQFDVTDESFREMEMIAYGEGPMSITIATRAISFAGHIFVAGLMTGFALRIGVMFLVGAALMKWGFFKPNFRNLHRNLFLAGMFVGLPMEFSVAWLYYIADYQMTWVVFSAEMIHWIASLLLMFGYIGGICMLVHAGALQWLQSALAAVGRMALTNYLLQSIVATSIMYWWGLGLFGELSRTQQLMLVVGIFTVQAVLSMLWLRIFRYGPLEWLWRVCSYGAWQPLFRG